MASYQHKIVDKKISHWTLGKDTKPADFSAMYPEMKQTFAQPDVTRVLTVIHVEQPAASDDMLQFWFNIGEAATEGKIEKWGVVVAPLDLMPKLSFERMVNGAGKDRDYQVKIGPDEAEILAWCKE